ncbi:MAG: hypothetical protein ABI597_03455 [Gammaproteobacteria bacterium]
MSMVQPLFLLLGINPRQFVKEELMLLEAKLFARICEEIREIIKEQNKDYFQIMKLNKEKNMLETEFIRCIINDILSTEEYNLSGIALYTDAPEDVIYDLASGSNTNPTLLLSRKIIELHRIVRPNLYQEIANKIKQELLVAA